MDKLISLYITFFKIGMFTFGGGYAMLPLIEKEIIDRHGWLTSTEFLDLLVLSQSSPGPIATNSATFIGFKYYGIAGSIVATVAVTSFSIISLGLFSPVIEKYKDSRYLKALFSNLRPLTIGFILSAVFSVSLKGSLDPVSVVITVLSFLLLHSGKLSSIATIGVFGIVGIILKGAL